MRELQVIAQSKGPNRHEFRKSQRSTGIGHLDHDQKAAKARRQRQKMKRHNKRFHLN